MVLDEIEEELQNINRTVGFNKSYTQKRPSVFRKASSGSGHMEIANPNALKLEPKIVIEVVGVVRCPDYNLFWTETFQPFSIKYPEIAAAVGYRFVSLSRNSPGHVSGAFAMHG